MVTIKRHPLTCHPAVFFQPIKSSGETRQRKTNLFGNCGRTPNHQGAGKPASTSNQFSGISSSLSAASIAVQLRRHALADLAMRRSGARQPAIISSVARSRLKDHRASCPHHRHDQRCCPIIISGLEPHLSQNWRQLRDQPPRGR